MKKGIQFLLVMCFALTLMGCQSEKKEEVKEEKQVETRSEKIRNYVIFCRRYYFR